jgi:hypothetical protein
MCVQDLMISLKELAVTQAADPCLARRFHLRTLRALGVSSLTIFLISLSAWIDDLQFFVITIYTISLLLSY